MLLFTTPKQEYYSVFALFGILLILVSSMATCDVTAEEKETEKIHITSLAVMPFVLGKRPENAISVMTCGMKSLCYEDNDLAADADRTMTSILIQAINAKVGDHVLIQEDFRAKYADVLNAQPDATPLDLAVAFGQALKVEYVVVGNVWRFRQRSGMAYASSYPASVAFNIHLVDVAAQSVVWKSNFEKSQKALSDNLLEASEFFRQGAKWLTVEELARLGVREVLKTFPLEITD